jgi:hypothetical protein
MTPASAMKKDRSSPSQAHRPVVTQKIFAERQSLNDRACPTNGSDRGGRDLALIVRFPVELLRQRHYLEPYMSLRN